MLGSISGEHTRAMQLTQSIDWAEKGAAGGKYGEVDMTEVGVAGQRYVFSFSRAFSFLTNFSCGGVEAYPASVFYPRVKMVGIHNTGVIDPGRRHYLKEIKQPIGHFYGGQSDFSGSHVSFSLTDNVDMY